MSLTVEKGGRELLRVEVLEARADGTAKFRLWYHKWQERPSGPCVDFEIKPYICLTNEDLRRFGLRLIATPTASERYVRP